MAAYNHELYIRAMLHSVLNQSYKDIELIVIDDGSTDRTKTIILEVAAKDPRVKVIVQSNKGIVEARNCGLSLTRGEYISIVDSDDLLPLDRTARLVEALEQNPAASMAYGDAWIIDEHGKEKGRFFMLHPVVDGELSVELFTHYCFVPAPAVMFRRSSFESSGPLWGSGAATDYLKWIELGLFGEVIRLTDPPLGCWRRHGHNLSAALSHKRAEQYLSLCQDLRQILEKHPSLAEKISRASINARFAGCELRAGFFLGLDGKWVEARERFRLAWGHRKSAVTAGAWISTLPFLTLVSNIIYKLAWRNRQFE